MLSLATKPIDVALQHRGDHSWKPKRHWTYRFSQAFPNQNGLAKFVKGISPVNKSNSHGSSISLISSLQQKTLETTCPKNTNTRSTHSKQTHLFRPPTLKTAPPGHEEQTLSTFLCQGLCCDQTQGSHATAQQVTGIWRQGHTPWNRQHHLSSKEKGHPGKTWSEDVCDF